MILRKNSIDRHRSTTSARTHVVRTEMVTLDLANQPDPATDDISCQLAVKKEQIQQLAFCMGTLSEQHQRVLELRFWRELPCDEIAEQTGRTTEAVHRLLYEAVEALVTAFRSEGQ